MNDLAYLLCLDSCRAWDRTGHRTRWIGGTKPPTERETHEWHAYAAIDEPVTGQPQQIVWQLDLQPDGKTIARSTRTSTFVALLPVDPTKGPWRHKSVDDGHVEGPSGLVTTSESDAHAQTVNPETAWLLACYLNIADTWDTAPAPTSMFDVAVSTAFDHGAVIAADYPVAIVPLEHLDAIVAELRRLPHRIELPMALRGAAANHTWTVPQPVATLNPEHMALALLACGLTDDEVRLLIELGPHAMKEALQLATDHEAGGHPWDETGLMLRTPRPGGSYLDRIRTRHEPR